MRILVYCGASNGQNFANRLKRHDIGYGFEANPILYQKLVKTFKNHAKANIVHGAITDFNGNIEFNVSNHGDSSSVGSKFHQDMPEFSFTKKHIVPAINIYDYLKDRVPSITTYISDIQGLDLVALRTLKPFIDQRKIESIQCEVFLENKNIYPDLPSNHIDEYDKLLSENYELYKTRPGRYKLESGVKAWWGDCFWKLK
jgi:FkbM family methyltransferase